MINTKTQKSLEIQGFFCEHTHVFILKLLSQISISVGRHGL